MSNQDWLDDLLRKLWDSGYHTALAEPFDNLTVPEAKEIIATKLAEERLAELKDLWMLYDEDCEVCCENKETIEVRIAELEAALRRTK